MKFKLLIRLIAIFLCLTGICTTVLAATLHVDCEVAAASNQNLGTKDHPYNTISAAIQNALPGDLILIFPCVYRESIEPIKGQDNISIVSAVRHKAVIRGTDFVLEDRESRNRSIRKFILPDRSETNSDLFRSYVQVGPSRTQQFGSAAGGSQKGDVHTLRGIVLVKGKVATEVKSSSQLAQTDNSWLLSSDEKTIQINSKEFEDQGSEVEVEVSTREFLLRPRWRGLKGINVSGLVFEYAANDGPFPQAGMVSTRSGRNWLIADNIIRGAQTIGLDIGSETWSPNNLTITEYDQRRIMLAAGNVVKGNVFEFNGLTGLSAWNTAGVKIVNNLFENNCTLQQEGDSNIRWEESAAIKVHNLMGGVIGWNTIVNNDCAGIWLDNGYQESSVGGNFIIGSSGMGIFVELGGKSLTLENNVVAYTKFRGGGYIGDGIYMHDASGVRILNNLLFANTGFGIRARVVSNRVDKTRNVLVEASSIYGYRNVVMANAAGNLALPIEGPRSRGNSFDENVYDADGKFRLGEVVPINQTDVRQTTEGLRVNPNSLFSLKQWVDKTGWDKSSRAVTPGRLRLNSISGVLSNLDQSLHGLLGGARKIEFDYFGNKRRDFDDVAGPFNRSVAEEGVINLRKRPGTID